MFYFTHRPGYFIPGLGNPLDYLLHRRFLRNCFKFLFPPGDDALDFSQIKGDDRFYKVLLEERPKIKDEGGAHLDPLEVPLGDAPGNVRGGIVFGGLEVVKAFDWNFARLGYLQEIPIVKAGIDLLFRRPLVSQNLELELIFQEIEGFVKNEF